jgi:protease I
VILLGGRLPSTGRLSCNSLLVYSIWVLCSTTALKGRTATGFHSIKDDMVNAGATFVDREVCVDGNVVTSRKPDDLPAFVAALMELIRKG